MQEFYTMIMMIDISNSSKELKELQEELSAAADKLNVKIYLQHEDVFRFMHRI
jgi:ACT domain-containing protein